MKFKDLVKETTTTTGTGPFVRGGAVSGFRAFTPAYNVGDLAPYFARLGAQWETGEGTVTATTVERTRVINSSSGGALVNFAAGTKDLYVSAPADFLNGATIADLPAAPSVPDHYLLEVLDPDTGASFKVTVAALRAVFGGTSPTPGDGTAPILSSATGAASGANGASGSISTNEANGILYCLASTGNTATKTAIKGGTSQAITSSGVKNFNVSGLLASTLYYLHFLHVDAVGNESNVVTSGGFTTQAAGTPATAPGAPTIGTPVAGDGYVDIAFTAPASNGGSAILDYTATLSTGQTATGTASPIRVTAPNGTAVTATVTARNSVGSSAPSAASASVTPAAPVAYTQRPYSSNAVKAQILPSTGNLDGAYRYYTGTDGFASLYWYVEPAAGAGNVLGGWGTSATEPPPVLATGENSSTGKKNGLVVLAQAPAGPTVWNISASYLWALDGQQSVPMYFWLKVGNQSWCLNPTQGAVVQATG